MIPWKQTNTALPEDLPRSTIPGMILRFTMSNVWIPLTLALSLRESEQLPTLSEVPRLHWRSQPCDRSQRPALAPKRRTILPCHKGEYLFSAPSYRRVALCCIAELHSA